MADNNSSTETNPEGDTKTTTKQPDGGSTTTVADKDGNVKKVTVRTSSGDSATIHVGRGGEIVVTQP